VACDCKHSRSGNYAESAHAARPCRARVKRLASAERPYGIVPAVLRCSISADVERSFNPFAGGIKSLPRGSVKPVPAERRLEDALFDFLEEHRFRPRRQVRTKHGIADVVLEDAILELKHELTPGALDSAVEQLWRYRARLGSVRLVIVCSTLVISPALRSMVELAVFFGSFGQWSGPVYPVNLDDDSTW
jgi:hypothetical protein